MNYLVVRRDVVETLSARLLVALVSDGQTTIEQLDRFPAYLLIACARMRAAADWAGLGVVPFVVTVTRADAVRWIELQS